MSREAIRGRVFKALDANVDFYNHGSIGVPASHLDEKVFHRDASFLKEAPFLSALLRNPNHIGCHTLGKSESFFRGTQAIERELIALCAKDILGADPNAVDGYVSSGGTEANMQAMWIYRNYFMREHGARLDEIAVLCSEDAHYSMSKGADILGIKRIIVNVDQASRRICPKSLDRQLSEHKERGIRFCIVVVNMMTTMFGSVDEPDVYAAALEQMGMAFMMHADGAYGGFVLPFTEPGHALDFRNPLIQSVTLDAHKMVQAPYGTGIFIARKGWMAYANTKEASYVEGEDCTIVGSRSGANAIAVWMILMSYGRFGWEEKMEILLKRSSWLENRLKELEIGYFRNPVSNIITIRSEYLNRDIASRYGLVPDMHDSPKWYKVVVMDHVSIDSLIPMVDDLAAFSRKLLPSV